jgi:hypothetical protein
VTALALVLACSVWPRTAERRGAARTLAAGIEDWDAVAAVATRHGVAALVAAALADAGAPVPPPLAQAAGRARLGAMRIARETALVAAALDRAGVAAVVLKGTPLGVRAFGDAALRHAADVDIAVAEADRAAAWSALAAAGYDRHAPAADAGARAIRTYVALAKDSHHGHPERRVPVELHWRLSDDLARPALPAGWRAVAIGGGRTVATLGDPDLFVYLCVHGAAHGWARLKWLADVAALLGEAPDGGAAWWRAAQAAGAERAAATAVLLCRDLLGVPPPPGFDGDGRRVRLLAAMAKRLIGAGGGAAEHARSRWRGWAEMAAKLLIAPGPAQAARVVRRLAVSAPDASAAGLPPGLGMLAPVVTLPARWRRRRARRDVLG